MESFVRTKNAFTMIELIFVIVILGILAAVAMPKFMSVSDDAEQASIQGVVGSLATARTMFLTKAALCGSSYGQMNAMHLMTFIRLDKNEPQTPTCDAASSYMSGHTMSSMAFRETLMKNPDADIAADNPNNGDTIRFETKTGRTITIQMAPNNGAISWSASPAYP